MMERCKKCGQALPPPTSLQELRSYLQFHIDIQGTRHSSNEGHLNREPDSEYYQRMSANAQRLMAKYKRFLEAVEEQLPRHDE